MKLFRYKSFQILAALFAFFVISGDLMADAVHDASGACVTESQSGDHGSCPACGCSLHTGAALGIGSDNAFSVPSEIGTPVAEAYPHFVVGSPAAIDHPPQLG